MCLHASYELKLMNRNNGLIARSFNINSNDLFIYSNQYIVTYGKNGKVICYDFEGKVDVEQEINNITPNNQLIGIKNDEQEQLIFFDPNQVTLNF